MTFTSYSQSGEDMQLRFLLRSDNIDIKTGGFYVDVGAHHPRRFSNTKFFYDLGWKGINLDPNENIVELFEQERPNDITLQKGVSNVVGEKEFHLYDEPAVNSVYNRKYEFKGSGPKLIKTITASFTTLSSVLDLEKPEGLNSPNFLTVDVEGHEIEVLKSNNWKKFPFDYVIVESKVSCFNLIYESSTHIFLEDLGYSLSAYNGLSAIYKKLSHH
jgi:FkbM family methyltransferase